MGLDMTLERSNGEELAYWGSSGWLYYHFFKNKFGGYQNDTYVFVEKEWLEELVDIAVEVIVNPEKASELLPVKHEHDRYDLFYFRNLIDTIYELREIIKSFDWKNEELYFYASW